MKLKFITPLMHGIIDYAFALTLLSVPFFIELNKKARQLYTIDALLILSYSALTKYPAGIKQIIPLSLHKEIDLASLALIALETGNKEIRKDKRSIRFSTIMIAAGVTTILLTDWKNQ